jgi:hypothetical protein
MAVYMVFNSELFGLMSQVLEGVETERKVESRTREASGSKEREYISNKATRKKRKKERKDIYTERKKEIHCER